MITLFKSPEYCADAGVAETLRQTDRTERTDTVAAMTSGAAQTTNIARVQKDTFIREIIAEVVTAWTGTSPAMVVGDEDDDDAFGTLDTTKLKAIGFYRLTGAKYFNAAKTLQVKETNVNEDSGAGVVRLHITYRTDYTVRRNY